MGRRKISEKNKAKPVTFSLFPEQINMLEELENRFGESRSVLLQKLIESEYSDRTKNDRCT